MNSKVTRKAFGWSSAYSSSSALKCLLVCAVVGWIYFLGFVHKPTLSAGGAGAGAGAGALLRGTASSAQAQAHDTLPQSQAARPDGTEPLGQKSGHFSRLAYHDYDTTEHLIVVAGHAVVRMSHLMTADTDDAAWWLLKYQRSQGFPAILSSHIKRGLAMLARDPKALLLFSGGQTRRDVGPVSEAASYYYVADAKGWIPASDAAAPVATAAAGTHLQPQPQSQHSAPRERVFLEEYARDSLENLMFSLCRFREVTGMYPKHVTMVGFDFKAERYTRLHAAAVGLSAAAFTYEGLTPGGSFRMDTAVEGEKGVVQAFETDPYACSNELHDKEELRNPFRRSIPYLEACPEMKELFLWCGPEYFPDMSHLPWVRGGK